MKEGYTLEEKKTIDKKYKNLLKSSYLKLNKEDKSLIDKAMEVATDAHKNQRRRSGEPYIYHPIEVAKIVSEEIGLGAIGIASALLHDVVEDSEYTLEDIEEFFGKKIAIIIDGLTKIGAIRNQAVTVSKQAENYKKLFFSLSEDLRVILIKIADRLHNMRTMEFMPSQKQKTISSETLYIFAPLAHRLSLYGIKSELEDLSLKYLESEAFCHISKNLEEGKEERENYIDLFIEKIKQKLNENGINYQIKGRLKSVFSIWKKMNIQKIPFKDVYDIFAIRIIYNSNKEQEKFLAWKIYSIITSFYHSNPNRLRDWISKPKFTGYESLHTTLMGPGGKWVEVQIRSERMDEIAEKGIAAHYQYKNGFQKEESAIDIWLNNVKEVLKNEEANIIEFVNNFKLNLYTKEIYVFTHKGDLISLPQGATTLDFAYNVHSEIGDSCLGAKVNGKLVALNYALKNGDQIEIINSSHQKPREDWLTIATTSKARSKIKSALKFERKKIAELGKEILRKKLKILKIHFNDSTINSLINYFKLSTSQELFYKVGVGEISNEELKSFNDNLKKGIYKLLKNFKKNSSKFKLPSFRKSNPVEKEKIILVFGSNEQTLEYNFSTCCNPIPGDEVFGFITLNSGIKIHKEDCSNALSLHAHYDYRIIKAKWVNSTEVDFVITLHIKGIDQGGIFKNINEIISEKMKLTINSININSDNGLFNGKITLKIKNKEITKKLISLLKEIKGVYLVERISRDSSN